MTSFLAVSDLSIASFEDQVRSFEDQVEECPLTPPPTTGKGRTLWKAWWVTLPTSCRHHNQYCYHDSHHCNCHLQHRLCHDCKHPNHSSLWLASAVTKSSLVMLEREEFRRLATTESWAGSYFVDCCLATSWRHFQPDVVERRGGFTRLARTLIWDFEIGATCCQHLLPALWLILWSLVWRQRLVSISNLSSPVLK